jgi:deleted-in-malignant-brain-tumors protein 1
VADGGWSNLEAQVACKQLNFQGGRAVTGSQYGKPNAPLLISNTDCTGNEQRLRDCQYTLLSEQDSTTLYSTAAVAGISCDSQSPTNISITSPTTIGLIIVVLLMLLFLFTTIGLVVFVVYKFKYGRGVKLRLTQRYTRGGGVNSEGVSNPAALTYSPVNDDSDDEADDDERLLQLVDDDK